MNKNKRIKYTKKKSFDLINNIVPLAKNEFNFDAQKVTRGEMFILALFKDIFLTTEKRVIRGGGRRMFF